MSAVQIKSVGVKHDAILDFLLTNPTAQMKEVARHFNVGAPWLSVIIHSDVFQARLAEKSDGLFHGTVIPLRERLMGVAHVGVEKLGEALDNASASSDKEFIADTTDQILKNLGYSPRSAAPNSPAPNVTNNVMVVDSATLAGAREKMREVSQPQPALEPPVEGVEFDEDKMPPTKEF